jgi:hypothetical protein
LCPNIKRGEGPAQVFTLALTTALMHLTVAGYA